LLQRFTPPGTPVYVIPNPAEFSAPEPATRSHWNPSGILRIGVVGRILFQQKNQNICVEVARQLKKRNFPFHFHIAGDGPDLNRLRQQVHTSRLTEDITFHGWVDNSELPAFLNKHIDVLLIPSHYEGVPLIMLEAFHMQMPFLVSDRHFVHDYNLPRNMLVDPRDASDIASKLIELVHSFDPNLFRRICETGLGLHSNANFSGAVHTTFEELTQRSWHS